MGKKRETNIRTVDEFMNADGTRWDEAKLREVCFDGDVEDILQIPIASPG